MGKLCPGPCTLWLLSLPLAADVTLPCHCSVLGASVSLTCFFPCFLCYIPFPVLLCTLPQGKAWPKLSELAQCVFASFQACC